MKVLSDKSQHKRQVSFGNIKSNENRQTIDVDYVLPYVEFDVDSPDFMSM